MVMHRVRTRATGVAGAPWYTNMYFGSTENQTAQKASNAVLAFWAGIRVILDNSVTFTMDPEVAQVDDPTGDIVSYTAVTGGSVVGQNTASALPPANQLLLRLSTQGVVRNRRVRGRVFIPGLVVTASDANGLVQADTITTVNTAAAALRGTTDVNWLVWSRPKPGASTGGDSFPVIGTSTWNQFSVLRSRRD